MNKLIKLDIGCGKRKKQGFIGIDIDKNGDADIIASVLDLPFNTNSVDEIYSGNVLEHIENLELLMKEIYRVLKPGGKKHIAVPHFSNPYYYSDPTHKNFFGLYSFYYYSDNQKDIRRKVPAYYFKEKFDVIDIELTFFSLIPFLRPLARFFGWLVNSSRLTQEVYEWYFSRFFPCYGIKVILKSIK